MPEPQWQKAHPKGPPLPGDPLTEGLPAEGERPGGPAAEGWVKGEGAALSLGEEEGQQLSAATCRGATARIRALSLGGRSREGGEGLAPRARARAGTRTRVLHPSSAAPGATGEQVEGEEPPVKGRRAARARPRPPRRSRAVAMATEALPAGPGRAARAPRPAAPGAGAKGRARPAARRSRRRPQPGTRRDRGGAPLRDPPYLSLPRPFRCPWQPLAPGDRGGSGPRSAPSRSAPGWGCPAVPGRRLPQLGRPLGSVATEKLLTKFQHGRTSSRPASAPLRDEPVPSQGKCGWWAPGEGRGTALVAAGQRRPSPVRHRAGPVHSP